MDLPNKTYKIIYADPPWKYKSRASHTTFGGGAYRHYPLMSMEDIRALPVPDIAADNCALFMWTTYPLLDQQLPLFEHWGFTYKTVGFTWVKSTKKEREPFFGVGFYTRHNAEACLFGIKGKLSPASHSVSSVVVAPLREHSQKPDECRDRIVTLFGDLPRIELFARQKTPGWDVWGNEV